ncbi:Lrp/AsnC family transcriptional regulator [Marinobacterium arenosum]|uniref:Lrp/AsnC family transcriptional regulator n=1 Tax=Marinobacterium arenosum TaxID=2862496 RepID=UPI001C967FE3|nr:Lrp/AsnC family transcriptional regulator [Marinobacterium arenosum]MBY4676970.1 Lrp/AsnC family transcriptional regulator [Marinobacterium arenosum]
MTDTLDTLDHIDRKILQLLQQDANLSATELADRVGLSQSPCWRRINRLQQAGYIRRKVALLDRQKLGLGIVVFVNIKLSSHGWNMLNEFEAAIVGFPEVMECWTMSGGMDYIIRVVTKDIESYEQFLRRRLLQLPHIQEAQSHITMTEVKNSTELPLG